MLVLSSFTYKVYLKKIYTLKSNHMYKILNKYFSYICSCHDYTYTYKEKYSLNLDTQSSIVQSNLDLQLIASNGKFSQ